MQRFTAVGEPEKAMKRRKALLSEEELFSWRQVCKEGKRASETREQSLHRQEQNRTHIISINTSHLACDEGSALQCCSFFMQAFLVKNCRKKKIWLFHPLSGLSGCRQADETVFLVLRCF